MPKLSAIINMPFKRVGCLYTTEKEKEAYQGAEKDIGDKSIGLMDVLDLERVLLRVLEKNRKATCLDYAQALKDSEDKIIVEVK